MTYNTTGYAPTGVSSYNAYGNTGSINRSGVRAVSSGGYPATGVTTGPVITGYAPVNTVNTTYQPPAVTTVTHTNTV